jgi:hypothetical protein
MVNIRLATRASVRLRLFGFAFFGFAFISNSALVILKVLECADIRSKRSLGIKR